MTIEFFNETPYPAFGFETELYDRSEFFCLAAKLSFDLAANGVKLREEQDPLQMGDRYVGEPGASSLMAATDLIPIRKRTDILLTGQARAPDATAVERWLAEMKVGSLYKAVQLTAPRVWRHRALGGWQLSPLKPVMSVPLQYELAFGGERPAAEDEERDAWLPNPVGRGYVGRRRWETDREWPAPQLLAPRDSLKDQPGREHATCGFGPIPGDWAPRVGRIGTTDAAWRREVAPHLPSDFDLRFFNCAPDDQQADGFLQGNEEVALSGLLDNPYAFHLPYWRATALMVDHDDLVLSLDMDLSTVQIDLDRRVLSLVWRLTTPANRWKQASLSLMPR